MLAITELCSQSGALGRDFFLATDVPRSRFEPKERGTPERGAADLDISAVVATIRGDDKEQKS